MKTTDTNNGNAYPELSDKEFLAMLGTAFAENKEVLNIFDPDNAAMRDVHEFYQSVCESSETGFSLNTACL